MGWLKKAVVALSLLAFAGIVMPSETSAAPTSSLTVLGSADTPTFDPVLSGTVGLTPAVYSVYDVLVFDQLGTGNIVPRLARSLSSKDEITWTLELRKDVKFSDGTVLDAAAVKFNWDRLATSVPSSGAAFTSLIQSTTVTGPLTLQITLKSANGQFPRFMALFASQIASPAAVNRYGKDYGTSPEKIVGAGPYILKSWTRDYQEELEANPNYWGGKPSVDRLVVRYVPDETNRLNTFQSGAGQVMLPNLGRTLSTATLTSLEGMRGAEVLPVNYAIGTHAYFRFNMRKAPFNDPRAREAVAAALDPKILNQSYYQGRGTPAQTIFPKGSPYYEKELKLTAFNHNRAQQLFDQIAQQTGKPVEFSYVTSDQTMIDVLTAILAGYRNVKMNPQLVPASAESGVTRNAAFDLGGPGRLSGNDPTQGWQTNLGAGNPSGYENAAMTTALQSGIAASTAAERKAAFRTTQQLVLKDLPIAYLPVFDSNPSIVVNTNAVKGAHVAGTGLVFWFDELTIKSKS